jgi:N4-gp56 family major capsid protein
MASSFMYNSGMKVYRELLAKKVEKAVWTRGRMSKFVGIIDVDKYKSSGVYAGSTSLRPTGNIIDIRKEFMSEGSLTMDVPVTYPLTGQGVVGSQVLRGNEEARKILTKKVHINQLRHGVKVQDSKMSKQALRRPELQVALMESSAEELKDWFTRKFDFLPTQAVLQGYSDNLVDSTYGIGGLSVKSHPNFYVASGSTANQVTAPTTFNAAYETAVSTSLALVPQSAASTTGAGFSAAHVRNIVFLAYKHKLQPIQVGSETGILVLIHPAQMRQLRADSEWQNAMKYAGVRGQENQLFTGISEMFLFEGALLLVDNTLPAIRITGDTGYAAAAGTVNYGLSTYMANPRDTWSRKPAIALGQGAILGGYASPLSFETEDFDYMQFKGEAMDTIIGFERGDITDDDGYFGTAGTFYENPSSLVYVTYSPDTIA